MDYGFGQIYSNWGSKCRIIVKDAPKRPSENAKLPTEKPPKVSQKKMSKKYKMLFLMVKQSAMYKKVRFYMHIWLSFISYDSYFMSQIGRQNFLG